MENTLQNSSKKIVVYVDSKGHQQTVRVRESKLEQMKSRSDIKIVAVKDEINVK
jgi:hypothetical protein